MFTSLILITSLAYSYTTSETRLESQTPDQDAAFGQALHIDGDQAIVGEPEDGKYGFNAGAAWMHTFNGTTWDVIPLLHTGLKAGDRFGTDVVVSGDWAVVGARSANGNQGAVYVFERNQGGPNQWGFVHELTNPAAGPFDRFGQSVDLEDGLLVVGAYLTNMGNLSNTGAAYVYEVSGSGFAFVGQLKPSVLNANDHFGKSCAVDSGAIACGAPYSDSVNTNAGLVHIFEQNAGGPSAWGETSTASGSGQANSHFGWSTDLSGQVLAVGAPQEGQTQTGAVYTFDKDTNWALLGTVTASDADQNDQFGTSVAIHGGTLLAGSPLEDQNGTDAGAVYLYTWQGSGWLEEEKVLPSTSADPFDNFGQSVAVGEYWAGTGAPNNDENSLSDSGSVYIFGLPDECGVDYVGLQDVAPSPTAIAKFGSSVAAHESTAVVAEQWYRAYVYEHQSGAWNQTATLDLPSGYTNLWIRDVDVHGDTAVVGAWATVGGAAFVFERDLGGPGNWGLSNIITAWDAGAMDKYANTVTVDGDTIAVGAPFKGHKKFGTEVGKVYVYRRDTGGPGNWGLEDDLWAADRAAGDQFGFSCDLFEETLACGAPWNGTTGAGYVFERIYNPYSGVGYWPEIVRYAEPSADRMGFDTAANSDKIAFGAPYNANYRGSVFTLDRIGMIWQPFGELTPSSHHHNTFFGQGLAFDGDALLVGARGYEWDPATQNNVGAAFLFENDGTQFTEIDLITPDVWQNGQFFGSSVALTCGQAVVGAPHWNEGTLSKAGSATFFQ
jgi:hypothetical protein